VGDYWLIVTKVDHRHVQQVLFKKRQPSAELDESQLE